MRNFNTHSWSVASFVDGKPDEYGGGSLLTSTPPARLRRNAPGIPRGSGQFPPDQSVVGQHLGEKDYVMMSSAGQTPEPLKVAGHIDPEDGLDAGDGNTFGPAAVLSGVFKTRSADPTAPETGRTIHVDEYGEITLINRSSGQVEE